MNITKTRNNFFPHPKNLKNENISFQGCKRPYESTYRLRQEAKDEIKDTLPIVARALIKVKDKVTSDSFTTCVNSVATAYAAIIISVNPFSDADKETKESAGVRQLVSAPLAILTQGLMVIPFDNLIARMANRGELGEKYDLRVRCDDKYIKSQIKAENKANGITLDKKKLKQEVLDRACPSFEETVNDFSNPSNFNEKTGMLTVKDGKVKISRGLLYQSLQGTIDDLNKEYKKENKTKSSTNPKLEKLSSLIKKNSPYSAILDEAKNIDIENVNFMREVVKTHIKHVNSRTKGFKAITGLIVGFATLPLTCYLLNKTYPKVIDTFFPQLNDKKRKPVKTDSKAGGVK